MTYFILQLISILLTFIAFFNCEECDPYANSAACDKFSIEDYPSPLKADHECPDYVKQDRGDQDRPLQIIKKGDKHQKKVLGEIQSMHTNGFFYVNGSNPGQEFLLCAMPKNGVTRTKILIARINGARGKVHSEARHTSVLEMGSDERMRLLNNSDIVRIKLVRNPYVRAISMYTDKIQTMKSNKKGSYSGYNMYFSEFPSFDDWVAQLYHNFQHNIKINIHFQRQYEQCWENIGLKFDHVLKVERFNYWYPCFVENFNLWQYVMRGWPDEDHCYFSSNDVPCNGPVQREDGRLAFEEGQDDGVCMGHRHDSFLKLREFYKNETTARKITQIYFDDIMQYDYPFWTDYMEDEQ